MGRKFALIIGNNEYDDSSLARLNTPTADVERLTTVLKSNDVGNFDEVITLVNEPSIRVRRGIAHFFHDKHRDDLLLLYFSGHGVLDDHGKLYLAVKDTERDLLKGTAIEASFITDVMDGSYSRQQVLILDCCHSGAFARGAKGVTGASVGTAQTFEGTGSGRVVLTATDATQYAWEGDQVIGQAENSVFTHFLIQGLQTGEADANADGRITLDELYDYAHTQVVKVTPKQNPRKWSFNQEGEIIVARNPYFIVKPVELPADLQQALSSPLADVRAGAIHALEKYLQSPQGNLALLAQSTLQHLTKDDSRAVSSAARKALKSYEARVKAEADLVERQRLAAQKKIEEERLAHERAEQDRIAREKAEAERLAALKAEQERLAREKAGQERLEQERLEAERQAKEKAEQERLARAARHAEKGRASRQIVTTKEITDTAWRITVPVPRGHLIVKRGPDAGKSFALKDGDNFIGRVGSADITIADTLISRRHVCIHVQSDRIVLQDLGSANGTFLNSHKVGVSTPMTLKDGDTITIGNTTFEFKATTIETPPKPVEPQPIKTAQPEMIIAAPPSSITEAIARPTTLTALGFGVTWAIIMAIILSANDATAIGGLIAGLVISIIILGLMIRSLGVPLKWRHFVALIVGWVASIGLAFLVTGLIINLLNYGHF